MEETYRSIAFMTQQSTDFTRRMVMVYRCCIGFIRPNSGNI